VLDEPEPFIFEEVPDVTPLTAGKVVDTRNISPGLDEEIAHPRTEESGSTGYEHPLVLKGYVPEIPLYLVQLFTWIKNHD
jgi:hypothetical protein